MVQRDKNPDTDEVIGHGRHRAHEEADDTQGHSRQRAHEELDDTEGHMIRSGRAHEEADDEVEGHMPLRKS
jgi:hypothetical protein